MAILEEYSSNIIPGAEPFEFGSGSEAILFVHGWSSSPRDVRFLAERLSKKYFCKGVLLNGHGTHSHKNMVPHKWQDFYSTVRRAYDELSVRFKSISVVGLSFGGALSLQLAKDRNIKNLILIAPFIRTPKLPIPFIATRDLIRLIPSFDISFPKKDVTAIDDPISRKNHISYRKMHIQALKELFKGSKVFSKNLKTIQCPTLLLHSGSDRTSSFSNSSYILKHLGSQDKTLVGFSNCNHIITLDYEREAVESQIETWLSQH